MKNISQNTLKTPILNSKNKFSTTEKNSKPFSSTATSKKIYPNSPNLTSISSTPKASISGSSNLPS
jgi:hypothetical protein